MTELNPDGQPVWCVTWIDREAQRPMRERFETEREARAFLHHLFTRIEVREPHLYKDQVGDPYWSERHKEVLS